MIDIVGRAQTAKGPVKDSKRNLLTSEELIMERWAEYFEIFLNRPRPPLTLDIQELSLFDLSINLDPKYPIEI